MKTVMLPKGKARYPHLNEPDEYEGQRAYKVDLIVDATDPKVEALIEHLEELRAEAMAEAVKEAKGNKAKLKKLEAFTEHPVVQPLLDEDGEETGEVFFRCKSNASFTRNGKTIEISPDLVDAKKRKLKRNVRIGGGSTIKVAVTPIPYCMAGTKLYGVSLRLVAVQVIELQQGGGAGDMFDEEEGFDSDSDDYSEDTETPEDVPFDTDDEAEDQDEEF